jgi:hypothetical protein
MIAFVPHLRRLAALAIGFVAGAGFTTAAAAQQATTTGEEILRGLESSFAFPEEELYVRRHNSEARELLTGLTVTASAYIPFDRDTVGARNTGEPASSSPALRLHLRYQPVGSWFVAGTFQKYLDRDRRAPWDPDFTYSFGYDDWRPWTLSLVYSNYDNNRFDPAPGNPITRLKHGTLTAAWKPRMPRKIARLFLIDDRLDIDCRLGANATPRFERLDGSIGRWKRSASFGCRYPVTDKIYVDFTAFAYEQGQQPWDPDFTYGFGLFDHRSGRLSLQYANYSGNRFPWRKSSPDTGRFRDGGLSLSWSHAF